MDPITNDQLSDEDNDNLVHQALPVAKLSKDVDLSIPPSTGEEYLSRVRQDDFIFSNIFMFFY